MIKIRKKLGKCVAMLLALIMVLTAPMTHMTVKGDSADEITINGVLQWQLRGDITKETADWAIWLTVDGSWNIENFDCTADFDAITIVDKNNNVLSNQSGAHIVGVDSPYLFLAIYGEYTKNHAPDKGDRVLVPVMTITEKTTGITQKTSNRAVLEYDGTNWNMIDDVLSINGCNSYQFASNHWNFVFGVTGFWNTQGEYSSPTGYKVTIKNAAGDILAEPDSTCLNWLRQNNVMYVNVWGEYTSKNQPAEGDTITIPAVSLTSTSNSNLGEEIAGEVKFKYNGTTWEKEAGIGDVTGYTKVEPSGFLNVSANGLNGESHHFYIKSSTTLPDTDSWQLKATIKIEVNGVEATASLDKYNNDIFWLGIPESVMPGGVDSTVVIKAGKYSATRDDYKTESGKFYFEKDWTFYVSKYGISTNNKILDKNVVKNVKLSLGDGCTELGIYYNTDKDTNLQCGGWDKRSKPAISRYSTDDTFYYAANKDKYGFKKGESFIELDERLININLSNRSNYIALSDLFNPVEDDTYTITGVFCDAVGNLTEYNEFKFMRTTDESGNVKYEEILDIDYTEFTLSEIYEASKYQEEPQRYDTYIKPSVQLPGADDTMFCGLKLQVGDGAEVDIDVYKAGYQNGSFFFMANESLIPKDVAKGTKITIKKGKAVSGDKTLGIELTEDYVMYALGDAKGFSTEKPLEYTAFNFIGLSKDISLDKDSNIWHMYIPTDVEDLPGDAWVERFTINLEIGGEIVKVEAMQSNNANEVYFPLSTDKLPVDADSKFVIRAGKYECNTEGKTIAYEIKDDFTVYTSKYGCSTNESVWTSKVVKAGFTLAPATEQLWKGELVALYVTSDDGIEPDADWQNRAFPITKGKKAGETVFVDTYAGLKVNGNDVIGNDVIGEFKLNKIQSSTYAVALKDVGQTAVEGYEYTIGGMYYSNVDGHIIEFAPITVKWDGSAWSKVQKDLDDTGVEADVNGDGEADVRDLIRLVHYHRTEKNPDVNMTRLDVNKDGDFVKNENSGDISSIRKILAGYVSYITTPEGGASATPSGTPSYSKKNKVEVMAYSCPNSGTWSSDDVENRTFTPSPTLDEDLKAYKDAGFTLLLSEFVGVLKNNELNEEKQADLVTYLKAAQRQGLGVIVCSEYINALLMESYTDGINFEKKIPNTNVLEWEYILEEYVNWLKKYPAFRGFMMADELKVQKAENYKKVCEYLKKLKPDINLHSSQLPVSAYGTEGYTPADLTTDTTTNSTKELAYKDYVKHFGMANDHYTFDLYSLIYSESFVGLDSAYSVNTEWYDNLKWTTDVIKDCDYAFTLGVTVQSCRIAGTDSIWSKYERYAPEQKSDIGFQVYTAMAYGAKEINYFSYSDHPTDTKVNNEIQLNEKVRKAVTDVNKEVASFGYVFKSFNWKNTLDIEKGGNNTSTENARLASVYAEGGRTFVGCMKDVDGFDGYMVANAEGPRTSNNATVTMTFNNAKSVTVYKGESVSTRSITDGVYTFDLNVGEGAFVIPNYN